MEQFDIMFVKESVVIGGRELSIETGRMAKQASGAALVQYGESVVLVTAVSLKHEREGIDFFPLTVDYVEKSYAAGKIPGNYFRREGRLSTHEILSCRLIDRPIRPLFPDGYRNETQVIALVLSMDQQNDPVILSMIGAGAALEVSDIPFEGPIAGIRVGRVEGQLVVNPTFAEREAADLDIIMAVGAQGIVMVEGGGQFVPEAEIVEALLFGQEQIQPVLELQRTLRKKAGKPKRAFTPPEQDAALVAAVRKIVGKEVEKAAVLPAKMERYARFDELKQEAIEKIPESFAGRDKDIKAAVEGLKRDHVRKMIVDKGKRIDGRGLRDVRQITCETGVLPCTHGSALFTRGETQALVTLTLGTAHDDQRIELLTGDETKQFLLHYNFPPFCVGEAKFMRGPSRRDIGHGALAERGLLPALPPHDDFPYTVRLVSEVLESNGSSSMATVCGSSLAMMDGGMPLSRSVAGIAMGLIKEGRKVRVLSDILGDEDHLGDMDFKLVGDRNGVSAIQMDIKITGLSKDVLRNALMQGAEARAIVLDNMDKELDKARDEMSPWSPRIRTIDINPDRIRDLIGPGGKNIRAIIEQTGAIIDVRDEGKVAIAARDSQTMQEALGLEKRSTEEAEIGKVYLGRVVKVVDFGAFVEILPGMEGLCHISDLSEKRIERTEDVVREHDEILVKVVSIERGKVRLSRRDALGKQANA